jgi:hypothetical protein
MQEHVKRTGGRIYPLYLSSLVRELTAPLFYYDDGPAAKIEVPHSREQESMKSL